MLINGIQCEVCTAQHIRDATEKSFPGYVPAKWLTVTRGTMHEQLHFCSKECLRDWLTERIHEPYPMCCIEHQPLGKAKASNDEALAKIRKFVVGKVEHSVSTTQDAWRHTVNDLLPLYLQFQILDMLDSIDSRLIAIEEAIEHSKGM